MMKKNHAHLLLKPRTMTVFAASLLLALTACSNVEKAKPRPESARVSSGFDIDVPQIMRGTIASEAVLDGYLPVVVRGYGLVVGLNGTGCRDTPMEVRAHMLAEMARQGVGRESLGYGHMKPEALLDSLDTAVVVVEAIIPPGAVGRRFSREALMEGTKIDVRVYAEPRTETTSLEGGRLWTAPLRPGPLRAGGGQASPLATASGEIFINPFAEPGAVERDALTRTVGLILNGGEVIKDMPLKLRLAYPNHVRAAMIQNTINSRFPREPMQPDPTARGESDSAIRITVPPSFQSRTDEFVMLLKHTTIRLAEPEAVALSVRRLLLDDPSQVMEASWRWQALGVRSLPIIRELYEYPEEMPRLAALRAGAKLDDALVVPHLIELAERGSGEIRPQSIELLAEMKLNPRIDTSLRALLNDDDVEVRLSAYEALIKRRDPYMRRYVVDGRKFIIDVVPSDKPLIYITQFGQPRVVIFGEELEIKRPVFVRAWSNRLMVRDIENAEDIEVFYRRTADDLHPVIHRLDPNVANVVSFLGHTTTIERPDPGLGMSYSEAVGALYQIWSQRYISADFKAEQDRILAAILRTEMASTVDMRPEFADEDSEWNEVNAPLSDLDRLTPVGDAGSRFLPQGNPGGSR